MRIEKDSIFRIQPTLIPHVSNTSFDLILNTCNECLMSFQSIGYIDPQLLTSNFKLLEDLAPYTLIELMKFAGSPLETIYLQIKKLVQGGSLLSCRAQEIFLYVKRTRQLYFSTIEVNPIQGITIQNFNVQPKSIGFTAFINISFGHLAYLFEALNVIHNESLNIDVYVSLVGLSYELKGI